MPSPTHQTLLLLFRSHPALVFELARRAGVPLAGLMVFTAPRDPLGTWCPPRAQRRGLYERAEEVTPEFDNPLAARKTVTADLALAAIVDGQPDRAVVIEVQLGVDLEKQPCQRRGSRSRSRSEDPRSTWWRG